MDMFKLAPGKVAVVTGSSRGLGYNVAEALLMGGISRVYISSRKQSACEEACETLNKWAADNNYVGKAISAPADVSSFAGAKQLADTVRANGDTAVHVLVANAGASWGESLDKFPEAGFDKVMDLNVKGVFATIQQFAPFLGKSGTVHEPARVVIMASVAGLSTSLGTNVYSYNASKAAVIHLAKALITDMAERNATINVLAPGFFPTKMSNGVLEVVGQSMAEVNPRKRLGVRDDIIAATLYLTSRGGNYVNGATIVLDGGMMNARA